MKGKLPCMIGVITISVTLSVFITTRLTSKNKKKKK